MSIISIGIPIPDRSALPGQTGGEVVEVNLQYATQNYCDGTGIFAPTVATPAGGVFTDNSSDPNLFQVNSANGTFNLGVSDPGNYIVTYTVSGVGSANFPINITALDDASFSYSASAFCADASNQTPTITTPGGNFTTQDITFRPFQMQFDTSGGKTITIPSTVGSSFTVDWGDTTVTTETGGTISHTYASGIATSTVSIGAIGDTGAFTSFAFNSSGSASDLIDIPQWGSIVWSSFYRMFKGCNNTSFTQISATDNPISNNVILMNEMFKDATYFNGYVNGFDTSNVENMQYIFQNATNFNQDLSSWNTSNVENMQYMFNNASSFNQDISSWNTSNVNTMFSMFQNATNFNQDISGWDVSSVTTVANMFRGTPSVSTTFNQNLSTWNLNTSSFNASAIFRYSAMSTANYTDTIVGWANYVYINSAPYIVSMASQTDRFFDRARSGGANFIAGAGAARDYLTGATANWTISGDTEIN